MEIGYRHVGSSNKQSPSVLVKANAAWVSEFDPLHSSLVSGGASSQQPTRMGIITSHLVTIVR